MPGLFRLWRWLAVAAPLLLAACASTELQAPQPVCANEFTAHCYPVWFATNRAPLDRADLSLGFGDSTDDSVHYGRVLVPLPPVPAASAPVSQLWSRLADPAQAIALQDGHRLNDSAAWERDLHQVLSVLDPKERDVVVYIHGFGNSFEETAEQAAMLGATLRVPGVMAMFSWPSHGKQGPFNYLSDLTAVENSEEELAGFLARLGRMAGSGRVHIVAHSLGVYGLLRSLQSATAQAQIIEPKMHFGQIILAAPDIDDRLFRRLVAVVPALCEKTTLYVADADLAVKASELIHGDHRVGLLPTAPLTGGIDTVEVLGRASRVEVGHSYFRDGPGVLKDIQTLIYFGESPPLRQQRNGFPLAADPPRPDTWSIRNER